MLNMNDKYFSMIPNKLLEVLMDCRLSSSEKAVLCYIARQTCGYRRETTQISIREFTNKLRISRRQVIRILNKLQLVKYVSLVNRGNSRLAFSEWRLGELVTPSSLVTPPELVTPMSRTSDMPTPRTEPVNKGLNKAAANSLEMYIVAFRKRGKTNVHEKDGKLYANGSLIKNPAAYLASLPVKKALPPEEDWHNIPLYKGGDE